MTMIKMFECGPLPITAQQLDEAEKETVLKFPGSYRQFMFATNGAIPAGRYADWVFIDSDRST